MKIKKIILLQICFSFHSFIWAQKYDDSLIFDNYKKMMVLSKEEKSIMKPETKIVDESLKYLIKNGFFITSTSSLSLDTSIQGITKFISAVYIKEAFEDELSKNTYDLTDSMIEKRIAKLEKRIDVLSKQEFNQYKYSDGSNQFLKSIHLVHDNDVFLFSDLNKDRDYTGGFKFEFMTDFLKMRLFKKINNTNVLSYQSFMIGGEAYTPYIRYTIEELKKSNPNMDFIAKIDESEKFLNPEVERYAKNYMANKQSKDRPFASFQYIARNKYRLNYLGNWRAKSSFKIGLIGGKFGENIQNTLHRDFTTKSIRVLNWDKQISNGGRIAFNIDHNIDLMLFSKESTIGDKAKAIDSKEQSKFNLNIYLPLEIHTGTETDAIGLGLGLSNRNFKELSGLNELNYKIAKGQFVNNVINHFTFQYELKYKYVLHNSLLEGFGWLNTFKDDPLDNEAISFYTLEKKDINRNLIFNSLFMGFRLKKASIYYKRTMRFNREYNLEATPKRYGWGSIGINFFL